MTSGAEFRFLSPDELEANAWNPNAMDQDDFNRLVAEIEEVGFINPVQVVPTTSGKYRILGGEHRVAAARELRLETIPAMVLEGTRWQDEDLQKLVTVRLNVLKGKLNPEKMAVLYRQMAEKYGEDQLQSLFAFSDQHAWDKMVSGIKRGLSKAGIPEEKRREFEEKAKEAKSLKDLERILNELWSSYGDTVQLSFMIFTYGRREHVYVSMDRKTRAALKKVAAYCKSYAKDINTVIGPAIQALADVLAKEESEAAKAAKPAPGDTPPQDDVPY